MDVAEIILHIFELMPADDLNWLFTVRMLTRTWHQVTRIYLYTHRFDIDILINPAHRSASLLPICENIMGPIDASIYKQRLLNDSIKVHSAAVFGKLVPHMSVREAKHHLTQFAFVIKLEKRTSRLQRVYAMVRAILRHKSMALTLMNIYNMLSPDLFSAVYDPNHPSCACLYALLAKLLADERTAVALVAINAHHMPKAGPDDDGHLWHILCSPLLTDDDKRKIARANGLAL